MPLRDKWTFPYQASTVAEAVKVKIAHHIERIKAWESKKEEVMENIKVDGIEVKESLGAGMTKNTAHYGAQVMVKAEYQMDLDECASKIQEHTNKLRDYTSYETALNENPNQMLELDVNDVQFFFAKI